MGKSLFAYREREREREKERERERERERELMVPVLETDLLFKLLFIYFMVLTLDRPNSALISIARRLHHYLSTNRARRVNQR